VVDGGAGVTIEVFLAASFSLIVVGFRCYGHYCDMSHSHDTDFMVYSLRYRGRYEHHIFFLE
jgi:hypothetical protein